MDNYFQVPLGIDIQTISDRDINELLQEMSRKDSTSEILKKSIHFFIEYYNKSVKKLFSMDYDELFVNDLLHNTKGETLDSRSVEMGIALDKLKIEFNRYLLSRYQFDMKFLMENVHDMDRFTELFTEFFKDRGEYLLGNIHNDDVYRNIANYLYQYTEFKNSDSVDNEMLQELYSNIMNYDAQVLAKYNRLLNLEAKLAHTSRMVFMTIYNTLDMKDDKLRELSVLSVMYHDIGRFYQALYYPNFIDRYVKDGEQNGEYNQLLQSHAEVGYYFPMQNLIVQDLIRCNGNMDETLVMHVLMSIVTKYHGRSNAEMSHYDVHYGDVQLDSKAIEDLERLMVDVFHKSKQIPVHARFDTLSNVNHMQEFHNDIATYIIKCIVMISDFKKGKYPMDRETEELIAKFEKYLQQYYKSSVLEDLYEHPEKLEDRTVLETLFGINPPEDFKVSSEIKEEDVSKRLKQIGDQILSVDYASTINDLLAGKETDVEITPELKSVLSRVTGAIMTITTDMDKIDIFNQRINGSWEKTNKSRFDREIDATGELTREEVIDDFSRAVFFSKVGEEPNLTEHDPRSRGLKILNGNSRPNAIKSLWFHLDQFITVNLRNYSSFVLLQEGDYLEKICNHMIEEQNDNRKEVVTPSIHEPIVFVKMFIDFVLHVRVVNGELVYPIFHDGSYHSDEIGDKPVLFTGSQMAVMRNRVLGDFKKYYQYADSKPMNGEYPMLMDEERTKRYQ